jgi:MFS superfamily sulfate permease-like transporter
MLILIASFFIYGVLFGVLISSCYFARKIGNARKEKIISGLKRIDDCLERLEEDPENLVPLNFIKVR